MKTVTMLEFRRDAARVLRRLAAGERFILSHRGKPAARLEPIGQAGPESTSDPFLTIAQRASRSPKGPTRHEDIDRILYGRGLKRRGRREGASSPSSTARVY